MSSVALPAELASLDLARAVRDPNISIEALSGLGEGQCWCGRPIMGSPRSVRLAKLPPELASFGGRSFHSTSCGVAYCSRAVNRLDGHLAEFPHDGRAVAGRILKDALVKLMGELLAFELTWL